MKYTCPVCGWPELREHPYGPTGAGSYEICPCCGIEFGYALIYGDVGDYHAGYREAWVTYGSEWWSKRRPAPENWNPVEQLKVFDAK